MHGALIDSELLARVYLAMTGGQSTLLLDEEKTDDASVSEAAVRNQRPDGLTLTVINASAEELAAHEAVLDKMDGSDCLYRDPIFA